MVYVVQIVKNFLASRNAMYLILALVIAQSIWYALVFQPTILDEGRHVGFVELYTQQLSPFIDTQNPENDWLGDTTRDPSYLYYYVLSFPLRAFQQMTTNVQIQIILLRVIHIFVFAIGIIAYDRFFTKIGFSKVLSRVVLLLLVLTPAISVLPGVVNYDSFVFLASGLLLLLTANMLQSKRVTQKHLLLYLVIFTFGALIKYTFLALSIPVTVFLLVYLVKSKKLKSSEIIKKPTKGNLLLGIFAVIGLVLFIERPVYNFIAYKAPTLNCVESYGEERCSKNYVQDRNISALDSKSSDFKAANLYEYSFNEWLPNMVITQVRLNPWDAPNKILHTLYFSAFFGGILLVLLCARELLKDKKHQLLFSATAVFGLFLLLNNYAGYVSLGQVVATSSRYLLPVQPLFMMLVLSSLLLLLKNKKMWQITILLVAIVVLITSGGSIFSYMHQADAGVRWSERQ